MRSSERRNRKLAGSYLMKLVSPDARMRLRSDLANLSWLSGRFSSRLTRPINCIAADEIGFGTSSDDTRLSETAR